MKKLIILSIILASCSPIRRHARIVKNHPEVHRTDSIKLIDTIQLTTDKVSLDTVISYKFDTVVMTKENLKVKLVRINDSIYIDANCDTIFLDKIIERNIPIKYYVEKPFNYWWLLLSIPILYLIFRKK